MSERASSEGFESARPALVMAEPRDSLASVDLRERQSPLIVLASKGKWLECGDRDRRSVCYAFCTTLQYMRDEHALLASTERLDELDTRPESHHGA